MTRNISVSLRTYRVLLRLLPAPFRKRFGCDLEEAFQDALREGLHERGKRFLPGFWLRTLRDIAAVGLRERLGSGSLGPSKPTPLPARRRGIWGRPFESVLQDAKFAWRTLRSAPGFAAVVVATIALGVGGGTAIFTVVDAILLRPLPFPDSERVVILCETHPQVGAWCGASPPQVRDWAASSSTIATFGLARGWPHVVRSGEERYMVNGAIATPGYFRLLRLRPAVGRLFTDEDMQPGRNRVAVLTQAFWQKRFGGDPAAVGQQITLDDESYQVIGVLADEPSEPRYGYVSLWTPLSAISDDIEKRSWRGFIALGRLKDGVTFEQAQQEMAALQSGLVERYPEDNQGWGISLHGLREWTTGRVRTVLLAFLGAVGFLLLIVCANVANLMLTRSTGRAEEFAIRCSLGASRRRLVQQLLMESLLPATLGGAVGVLLAQWGTRAFIALAPQDIPRLEEVGMDLRALLFALLLSWVSAALFGMAPAWMVSRTAPGQAIQGSRTVSSAGGRIRSMLVAGELALALVLLAGAGLLVRSFANLSAWDPGFETSNLSTVWTLASFGKYSEGRQVVELQQRAAEEVAALPEVESVGLTSAGPLFGGVETTELTVEGRSAAKSDEPTTVRWYDISPGYFGTMGIPLLAGRDFDGKDVHSSPLVAIVNEALARRCWPEGEALGKTVSVYQRSLQIVGIVRNVAPLDPDLPPQPEIFWPKAQSPRWATYLVIRHSGAGANLEKEIRQRLEALDPDLQISGFSSLEESLQGHLISPRFNMLIAGVFASVALLLAGIGIYGVFNFFVAARRQEIGVRIALGAGPGKIVYGVVKRGLLLALAGAAIGAGGAVLLTRLISTLLHGVRPEDPLTWGCVLAVLLLVVLAACYLPARKAGRVDPMLALRNQ